LRGFRHRLSDEAIAEMALQAAGGDHDWGS